MLEQIRQRTLVNHQENMRQHTERQERRSPRSKNYCVRKGNVSNKIVGKEKKKENIDGIRIEINEKDNFALSERKLNYSNKSVKFV